MLKELPVGDLQPDETVDAMHEAGLLRNLDHPGIIKFYDSFIDGEFFCIITEFAEVKISFPETEIAQVCGQQTI